MEVREPDMAYTGYSYADYITWTIEERFELIKGKVFKMNAPRRMHQKVSGHIFYSFYSALRGKSCDVYEAPFDVRLPKSSLKNEDIFTVVQPDICIICDPSKLDDAGCIGAPDLVVEILSPSNNRKELKFKFDVYEENGVKEYWIVSPEAQTLQINVLVKNSYQSSRLYSHGDVVGSSILPGYELNVSDIFEDAITNNL